MAAGRAPEPRLIAAVPVVLVGVVLISGVVGDGAYGETPCSASSSASARRSPTPASCWCCGGLPGPAPGRRPAVRRDRRRRPWSAWRSAPVSGGIDLVPPGRPTAGWSPSRSPPRCVGWLLIAVSLPRVPGRADLGDPAAAAGRVGGAGRGRARRAAVAGPADRLRRRARGRGRRRRRSRRAAPTAPSRRPAVTARRSPRWRPDRPSDRAAADDDRRAHRRRRTRRAGRPGGLVGAGRGTCRPTRPSASSTPPVPPSCRASSTRTPTCSTPASAGEEFVARLAGDAVRRRWHPHDRRRPPRPRRRELVDLGDAPRRGPRSGTAPRRWRSRPATALRSTPSCGCWTSDRRARRAHADAAASRPTSARTSCRPAATAATTSTRWSRRCPPPRQRPVLAGPTCSATGACSPSRRPGGS